MSSLLRLMTWRRACPRLFPYGSSMLPYACTVGLLQFPVISLSYDIFSRQLLHPILSALLILLDLICITTLSFCTFSDPGILPQIISRYEVDSESAKIPASPLKYREEHNFLVVGPWGMALSQKYCVQCCIYRPFRTIHCRICNHCVERYDHHCPWLGVCVGKYNYIYFVWFIGSISLISVYATIISLVIMGRYWSSGSSFTSYILEFIVGTFSACFGAPLVKLFIYHCQLMRNGLTTNQDLKKIYSLIKNDVPFRTLGQKHPPILDLKTQMKLTHELQDDHASAQNRGSLQGGKRYSSLVSERQSVLHQLVEAEL